jgi:hypothetical protein
MLKKPVWLLNPSSAIAKWCPASVSARGCARGLEKCGNANIEQGNRTPNTEVKGRKGRNANIEQGISNTEHRSERQKMQKCE